LHLLNLKLIRDINQARWQFAAVALVVGLGIGFYQGSWMSYQNIGASYELYYDMLHFADFQIVFGQAPDTVHKTIAKIAGVTRVQPRIAYEVELEMPVVETKQVVGRLIGVPDVGRSAVNDVLVLDGRYVGPAHKREVLVERSFAEHHELKVGDYVYPVVDGETTEYRIAGIAMGPEYLYAIRSKQYLMPTPATFGVLWLRRTQAERLTQMSGLVNEVCVCTEPARADAAMRMAHKLLKKYGAEEAVPRAKQPSNYLLQQDVSGFRQMAIVFPLLFLFAASLTIYTLLVRIVNSQRGQIGFLRASGMSLETIIWHYMNFALVCGFAGSVGGVIVGTLLSRRLTAWYLDFLNIPVIANPMHWGPVSVGVAVGVLSCAAAGYFSTRRVAMLAPAVALREEAVSPGHQPLIERWLPFVSRASFFWRIPIRNIFRNARRAVYTAIGIAIGVSLVLVSLANRDAMLDSIGTYLEEIMRYDLQAAFMPPQTASVGFHVAQWPGVTKTEAAIELPVEVHRGEKVLNTVLIGLEPGSHLQTLVSPEGRPLQVHGGTLLISRRSRRKLGVEGGDVVRLAFAHNDEDINIEVPVRVGEVIRQPVGTYVYMPAAAVRRIFEAELGMPSGSVTALMVRGADSHLNMIKKKLYKMPNVAAVEDARHIRDQLLEMIAMSLGFTAIMVALGCGLALAIIYNTVSINIVERTRELASMRAMGMSRKALSILITVENLMLGFMGLAGGIPLGYLLNVALIASWENEMVQLQAVILPRSYLITIFGAIIVILLSQIPGIRGLHRMDLAQATKFRG